MTRSHASATCYAEVRRDALLIALGTYVRVRLQAQSAAEAEAAMAAARAAVAACETRFSMYRPESELCLLNAFGASRAVAVSDPLFQLLMLCDDIATGSDYLFDPAIGGSLVERGLRPGAAHAGQWSDVRLDRRNQAVKFLRPLTLDLGGIAKGAAVDCAVDAAMAGGATGVLIDAGGDMRAAGKISRDIRVRDPRDARRSLPLMRLQNAAVATSGGSCALRDSSNGTSIMPTLRAVAQRYRNTSLMALQHQSVSVTAARCAVADALTKVVQLSNYLDHPLLARFGAQALRIDASTPHRYVIEASRAAA